MCGTQLEPPSQEHVDEKECSNKLQQRIAMAMIGESGQNNMTTLSEVEKSNASANSEESDAKNDITTLLLKHEYVNYSYQHLPQQSHDDMLGQQDGGALLMEYEEASKVRYDCLGDDTLTMVIPSNVGDVPKSLLKEMIEKSEENDGCMFEDFKRDGPSLGLHRILVEDCYSNWPEQQLPQQRRLHPTKMEDDKNEVIKWLGVDITFRLNISMPSRMLARWRVFMDYKGTRKKYTSMVAQKWALVSILAQFFFGNIVTRWRVRMDYKKYRKKCKGYLTPLNFFSFCFMLIFILVVMVVRFASSPGRSFWDFCSLVYSGGLSRDLEVNSVEIKDSSASCHQEIKLLISPVNRRTSMQLRHSVPVRLDRIDTFLATGILIWRTVLIRLHPYRNKPFGIGTCFSVPIGFAFRTDTISQIEKGPESIKAQSRPRYFQPRPKDVTAERDKNAPEYSPIFLKGGMYQQEGRNKVKVKDLEPKHIKDYLECKISQRSPALLKYLLVNDS
ncbi:hypothetical protein GQ457_10G009180 [Hibiscus cannabinus]